MSVRRLDVVDEHLAGRRIRVQNGCQFLDLRLGQCAVAGGIQQRPETRRKSAYARSWPILLFEDADDGMGRHVRPVSIHGEYSRATNSECGARSCGRSVANGPSHRQSGERARPRHSTASPFVRSFSRQPSMQPESAARLAAAASVSGRQPPPSAHRADWR